MMRAGDRSSRAVLGSLFVWVVLLGSLGFAASSDAQEFDDYLIADGPGFGVLLQTRAGVLTVSPNTNLVSRADGNIGGIAGDHCNGKLHFHGSLADRPDPDPEVCGWGKVTKLAEVKPTQYGISFAIAVELVAHSLLSKEPPDYAGALTATEGGKNVLGGLKIELSTVSDLITRQIDVAIKTDKDAIEALNRLKNGTAQPKDRQVAERNIRVAIEDKRRVFRSLGKAQFIP